MARAWSSGAWSQCAHKLIWEDSALQKHSGKALTSCLLAALQMLHLLLELLRKSHLPSHTWTRTNPARWWHEWDNDQFDELAGALVAGHLIECSSYVCG